MAGSPVASPFPYDRKLWFFPDERSIMTDCCTRSLGSSLGGGRRQTLIWRAFSPAVPALSGPASESGRNDEALVWVGCPRTGSPLWPAPSCRNTACLRVGRRVSRQVTVPGADICCSCVNELLQNQRQLRPFRSARPHDADAAMLAQGQGAAASCHGAVHDPGQWTDSGWCFNPVSSIARLRHPS